MYVQARRLGIQLAGCTLTECVINLSPLDVENSLRKKVGNPVDNMQNLSKKLDVFYSEIQQLLLLGIPSLYVFKVISKLHDKYVVLKFDVNN